MRRCSLLVTLWGVTSIRAQYGVPVFAAPPVLPVVMPAVAIAQPHPRVAAATTTTSTTTTARTPRGVAVAVPVPVPVPLPVQFPVAGYAAPRGCPAGPARPSACPPCPPCLCSPSCTPAFFSYCSPCHQKCRCRDPANAPQPLPPALPAPLPVPLPPPVLVVPFPPLNLPHPGIKHKPTKYTSSDASSCDSSRGSTDDSSATSDSSASSDTDYFYKRTRKQKARRKRRRRPARPRGDRRVRPVLTYLSRSGDIKYKAKISEAQAARLLGERAAGGRRVAVVTRRAPRPGRKEILIRPPAQKAISNLSVSFQISK